MDGPARTALVTSVLGTARVFIILVAGFTASKFPRQEREWDWMSTLESTSSSAAHGGQPVKRPPLRDHSHKTVGYMNEALPLGC